MSTATLDTKGLICPLPILKTKKAMKELEAGDTLTVEATDPSSVKDMQAFCRVAGHELLACDEADGIYTYQIRKSA
ncbi:MAG TPA: sulfurtransferase TusA family protein [Sneathiellales bacterium]|jgi:tRNA 2-thiouridine synthesizing protein A|nr:sulfurtransferase TusA family protein [Sneathiellales bacterium]